MLALIFGSPVALALVCDSGDLACSDANELRDRINALQPGAITDTHASARRRTSSLRDNLERLYLTADASGCTMDGLAAFVYSGGSGSGDWSRSADAGAFVGVYGSNNFSGSFTGDASGSIGDFGIYYRTRLAAEWDADDAFIGAHIRTIGANGVGYAAIGSCPIPIAEAFVSYLPELAQFVEPDPPDPTTAAGAGFLRVQVLDAAAGGTSTSPSYSMAFTLGGAQTPAESGSNLLNPSIPVP